MSNSEEILVKPAKTFEEQYEILKSRGCIINDKNYCIKKLGELNYYRLSGYLLPFKHENDTYTPVKFETIVDIYDFDVELRNWCILALEEIEVFMRTQIAYYHSRNYEPLGYLERKNFTDQEKYTDIFNDLQKKIKDAIKNNENSRPIKHHIEKYKGQIPLWVLVDYLPFGTLVRFFECLKNKDKIEIINSSFTNKKMRYEEVESHLYCLSVLRNACAHYEMLYNRNLRANPKGIPETFGRKIFSRILAIKNIYPDQTKWNMKLVPSLEQIIYKHKQSINLELLGFSPHNEWKKLIRF